MDILSPNENEFNYYDQLHQEKYRDENQSYLEHCSTLAKNLAFNETHKIKIEDAIKNKRFLAAGRVQAALGATEREVSPFNCSVSQRIDDSMQSIMAALSNAAQILRLGTGIGYNFSHLRPKGAEIRKLKTESSGPLSFMRMFDVMASTIASSGHRRGAQMGIMNVDHPDIEAFIDAKMQPGAYRQFNLSVGVTDKFMAAVENGSDHILSFAGQTYRTVKARKLWEKITNNAYNSAEPGIIFIDRLNQTNNLHYCENIEATNPSMPAGTLVHTNLGVLPIEKLEGQKFKIKSMDGVWAEAKCFLSGKSKKLIELNFGGGRTIQSTPEHKWPVLKNGQYENILTSELKEGDLIPANRNEDMGHNLRTDLSYEDGFITGMVFGNGAYNIRKDNGKAYISVHFNKEDWDLHEITADYFDVNINTQMDECIVGIHSDEQARAFIDKVGLTFGDKSILPNTVWNSNDNFTKGFVDGLITTDGHIDIPGRRIVLTNKNHNVIKEFSILLGFYGVLSTFRDSKVKFNDKIYNRTDLTLSKNNIKRFINVFKITGFRKNDTLKYLTTRWQFTHGRSNILTTHNKICAITEVNPQDVWDISVNHNQHVFPTQWGYTGNCSEQPLPPYGLCLLGSFNLVSYLSLQNDGSYNFNYPLYMSDIDTFVEAYDNIFDKSIYAIPEHKEEAINKRRMGLGLTGIANAIELLTGRASYGEPDFIAHLDRICSVLTYQAYTKSADLAKERGAFNYYKEEYNDSKFIATLPLSVRNKIRDSGIRNSHLISYAPCGTISQCAGNISSGVEPVFYYQVSRDVYMKDGKINITLNDYNYRTFNFKGKTLEQCSVRDHLNVARVIQKYTDSAVSKTVNVASNCSYEDYEQIYKDAYKMGLKGITVYKPNEIRGAVIKEAPKVVERTFENAHCANGACYL